jgi:hypothetical protein
VKAAARDARRAPGDARVAPRTVRLAEGVELDAQHAMQKAEGKASYEVGEFSSY